jgi:hypothetical protein
VPLPDRVPVVDGGARDAARDASDGAAPRPPACTNGVKDGDETDVDCGGASCAACADGRACAVRRDCASLLCAGARCTSDVGCSDGAREGFASATAYPNIAACAGGWSVPGVLAGPALAPACDRASGDDSANASGAGCSVTDLCQPGWHVCATAAEVAARTGGAGCADAATAGAFYVTRQSGPGAMQCGAGANDLFGCGGVGAAPDGATCGVLSRFSNDLCVDLPAAFACGADGGAEAANVTKSTDGGGGALCCRD